jgi:hypothetical protein
MGSWEKPWEEPFDELLTDLESRWGGEIWRHTKQLEDHRSSDYEIYPKLRATLNRYKIEVEINELPLSGSTQIDAADNVEYLRLFVPCPLEKRVLIRHEGFFDRVAKKLRMTWEFQTGNDAFDRKYFLNSKKGEDLSWIAQPEVLELIESLEPFTGARIFDHGIQWSREIRDRTDLDADGIAAIGERLVNLAELLKEELI